MTIWCKHVHRLELQKFYFIICAAHLLVKQDIEKKSPYFLLAPAVTVGERRELWILPPFFLASSFAYNFVRK